MSVLMPHSLERVTGGRWLCPPASHDAPPAGIGLDSRENLMGRIFFAVRGERHDGHDHLAQAFANGAIAAVVERPDAAASAPGRPVMLVPNVRRALGQLASAHRDTLTNTTVIAITGSAGKTTTKHLLGAVLRAAMIGQCAKKSFNNDIGVPLSILEARPDDRFLVLEVGTNARGEIAALAALARPDIAIITSIGRAHLAGLGTVADVLQEKGDLLIFLAPGGLAVLPSAWPQLGARLRGQNAVWVGEDATADLRLTARGQYAGDGGGWLEINGGNRFDLRLPGRHNALNAIMAIAAARHMGVSDATIAAALAATDGPPMRLQRSTLGGITMVNDAYNANPESMLASLHAFVDLSRGAARRVLILGDMLELGETAGPCHEEIGRAIAQIDRHTAIARVVFVGHHAADVKRGLGAGWSGDRFVSLDRLDDPAAAALAGTLRSGDAVLLKGSRRIGLERVAAAVAAAVADAAAHVASAAAL